MVYQWDDKEGECYRLYVEEKKSLDEVIAYWESQGFTPRYVNSAATAHMARRMPCQGHSYHCTIVPYLTSAHFLVY